MQLFGGYKVKLCILWFGVVVEGKYLENRIYKWLKWEDCKSFAKAS